MRRNSYAPEYEGENSFRDLMKRDTSVMLVLQFLAMSSTFHFVQPEVSKIRIAMSVSLAIPETFFGF
jgi:hypothetical protein